jgi:hypothetical protein
MIVTGSRLSSEFSALQVPYASDLGPLDRANTLNPDTKTTHCAMTNHSKLHPGEFSRDIAKWHRGVIADIKQLTRGITRGNQVYLPQIVLSPRPRRVIRVTACQAPENMRMKDDSYVCWKDSSGGRGVAGLGPRGADRKAGAVFQCWSPPAQHVTGHSREGMQCLKMEEGRVF